MFKNPWVLGTAIIFPLICLGLVLFGVFTGTEAGLTRPGTVWDQAQFPLKIRAAAYASDSADSKEAENAVASAVDHVNRRLGFSAYVVDQTNASVVDVVIGVPTDNTLTAPVAYDTLSIKDSGGAFMANASAEGKHWVNCYIRTANTGSTYVLGLVLQHELGHCLGLAHDDFSQSIMYPTQSDWAEGTFPPTFTDSDRKLLRKMYSK